MVALLQRLALHYLSAWSVQARGTNPRGGAVYFETAKSEVSLSSAVFEANMVHVRACETGPLEVIEPSLMHLLRFCRSQVAPDTAVRSMLWLAVPS